MIRITILLLFAVMSATAQDAKTIVTQRVDAAKNKFQTLVDPEFIVAVPYTKVYTGVRGLQFYNNESWSSGSVSYKGKYHVVKMIKYDCKNDLMVTVRYTLNGPEYLSFMPNVYPEVTLENKKFVYHTVTQAEQNRGIGSGYYHVRTDGSASLYYRYWKTISEQNGVKVFVQQEEAFLEVGGELFKLKRLANLIDELPQYASYLSDYAEKNSVNKILPFSPEVAEGIVAYLNRISLPK